MYAALQRELVLLTQTVTGKIMPVSPRCLGRIAKLAKVAAHTSTYMFLLPYPGVHVHVFSFFTLVRTRLHAPSDAGEVCEKVDGYIKSTHCRAVSPKARSVSIPSLALRLISSYRRSLNTFAASLKSTKHCCSHASIFDSLPIGHMSCFAQYGDNHSSAVCSEPEVFVSAAA